MDAGAKTSITLKHGTLARLQELKLARGESYDDEINRLIDERIRGVRSQVVQVPAVPA